VDAATREAVLADGLRKSLVKHVADSDEIADAVSAALTLASWQCNILTTLAQYLFAMKCRYFTGQEIIVDGGASLL
jgi:hypothetical protein